VYCGQTVGWIKIKLGTPVGLGPGHIVLDGDPALLPPKGTQHGPKFSAHIPCGQMAGWITMPLGMEAGLGSGDFVLDGNPAPYHKRGGDPPNFRSMSCGQTAGWIKMALGMEVGLGLGPGHIVLDVDPMTYLPSPKRHQSSPVFGPCLLWPNGLTAGWIKMPVGTEIGLDPGDIVLDGVRAPLP